MKSLLYCFLFGMGTYFLFSSIGKLIDKSGLTLEDFCSIFIEIRDSIPVVVFIVPIVFIISIVFKCIDNIM